MSYQHLSMDERNVIWRMMLLGKGKAETARCLGRSRSTIGRELRRNVEFDGRYFPGTAQGFAGVRRRAHMRRPRTGDAALMAHVEARLQARWSPEQIAGRLKAAPPKCLAGRAISHATIYRWIWASPERSQRLRPYLRVACKPRRKPYGKPSKRGQIPGRVSIDERPAAGLGVRPWRPLSAAPGKPVSPRHSGGGGCRRQGWPHGATVSTRSGEPCSAAERHGVSSGVEVSEFRRFENAAIGAAWMYRAMGGETDVRWGRGPAV